MRHQKIKGKLSRRTGQRKALMRSLADSLFRYETIKTSKPKAKVLRGYAERLITTAKTDTVQSRRKVARKIEDKSLVKKLFTEIAPLYANTNGGYTRIIPFDYRRGDGADMAIIELTQKTAGILEKAKKKEEEKLNAAEEKSKADDKKPALKTKKQVEKKSSQAVEEATVTQAEKIPDENKGFKDKRKDEKKKSKPFLKNVSKIFRRKREP